LKNGLLIGRIALGHEQLIPNDTHARLQADDGFGQPLYLDGIDLAAKSQLTRFSEIGVDASQTRISTGKTFKAFPDG
jgi:hypothetical protein